EPYQFGLALLDADVPVLALELLCAERFVGVGRATHDVAETGDLVDVIDELPAEKDQLLDSRGDLGNGKPDHTVLERQAAKGRHIRNWDQDRVVVLLFQGDLD